MLDLGTTLISYFHKYLPCLNFLACRSQSAFMGHYSSDGLIFLHCYFCFLDLFGNSWVPGGSYLCYLRRQNFLSQVKSWMSVVVKWCAGIFLPQSACLMSSGWGRHVGSWIVLCAKASPSFLSCLPVLVSLNEEGVPQA